MTNLKTTIILIFISILGSCNSPQDDYTRNVLEMLQEKTSFQKKQYTHIVIIPGSGCPGCISEAESFFMDNSNEKIFFIFTKIYSSKNLKLRLGIDKLNKENVYLDKENTISDYPLNENLYPIIIDISDSDKYYCKILSIGEDINI